MIKLIITALLSFTILELNAQTEEEGIVLGNVVCDTATLTNDPTRAFTPILESKNKIEIRFTASAYYVVLTFNKKWDARHFYYLYPKDTLLPRHINSSINLDTLFSKLVTNNVFSLPDQDSLKIYKYVYDPKKNEFSDYSIIVEDGMCYSIEFKVGHCYRKYQFSNPDVYASYYPSAYEYRNFANITNIFYELIKE